MKRLIFGLCFLLLFPSMVFATRLHPESYYQKLWCEKYNGQMEYILPDRTRIDCLTDRFATEIDFADKWAEAIGQSLHYSLMIKRDAQIVLILEKDTDRKYLKRINNIIDNFSLPIDVRVIYVNTMGQVLLPPTEDEVPFVQGPSFSF